MEKHLLDDTQSRFTPDVGTVEGPVVCGVCGREMICERNCHGPRGFVMAMSGSKSDYDSFQCSHMNEKWHVQVVKLRELANDTPSGKLAKMFREEAMEVLESKKATKEGCWMF